MGKLHGKAHSLPCGARPGQGRSHAMRLAEDGADIVALDDQWQNVVDVNLTGVWRTVKSCVPSMIARGLGGVVVLTSSLAAAEVRNLVCADGEFDISFHPSGLAGGYAEHAVNALHLRAGDVEVVVADLADVIRSKEFAGRPKDLRVLPLLYRHLFGRRAEREAEQR